MSPAAEARPSELKVAAVVTFYIVAALTMVSVNKWILLSTSTPIFIVWCQLVVAVILLLGTHLTKLLHIPPFKKHVAVALWKLTLVNVLGLSFNNLCLQYVDASFYQIARGLLLPITVGLAFAVGQLPPSPKALGCCAVVTAGFFVGVLWSTSSVKISTLGVIFGVLSSCTTAVHSLVIKASLDVVDNSAVALAWYSNLLSMVAILPLIPIAGEIPAILNLFSSPTELWIFGWGVLVTGVFGFLICVAGFLSIKVTSPITHMISSSARGIVQTAIGVVWMGDVLTNGRLTSIAVILVGSCAYVRVKHNELMEIKANESARQYELVPSKEEDGPENAPKGDASDRV